MAIKTAQISVTTGAAAQLVPAATFLNTVGTVGDPIPAVVENQDATNPVYLGPIGVTSSTGVKLVAGASHAYEFIGSDASTLYAIATGGTVAVGVELGRQ